MLGQFTLKLNFQYKRFKSFRKTLPLDYKKGDKHTHKNTHAMPLSLKHKLLKAKKGGDMMKIRQIQRQSLRPFGRFTKSGFKFDKQKLPFFDIPNIQGFELKPYVDFNAPRIEGIKRTHQQSVNEAKLQEIMNDKRLPL